MISVIMFDKIVKELCNTQSEVLTYCIKQTLVHCKHVHFLTFSISEGNLFFSVIPC